MSSPTVPDPAALRGETLSTLVTAYGLHRTALVNALHGIGGHVEPDVLRGSALSALAVIGAILEHVLGDRAATLLDAIRYGASLEDIATATGYDVDEVLIGARSWLSRLAEQGALGADDVDAAAGFLDRAEAETVAARGGRPAGSAHLDRLIAALTADARDDDGEVQS